MSSAEHGATAVAGAAAVDAELVDRVRSRLAAQGRDPDPDEVVRAVRAESGGLHGHLDLLHVARLVRERLAGRDRWSRCSPGRV